MVADHGSLTEPEVGIILRQGRVRSGSYRELTVPGGLPASAYAVVTDLNFPVPNEDRRCAVTSGELLHFRPFVLVDAHIDLGVLDALFVELLLEHVGEVAFRV